MRELRALGSCLPYEKEYLRRDGTRVPVYLADALLSGPDEQIVAFVLDLTERKRVESALRESEERSQRNPRQHHDEKAADHRFRLALFVFNRAVVEHGHIDKEALLGRT